MPERYRKAHLKGLERFYKTGEEQNIIVQNHQGQITFSSKPGKTCFVVRLPFVPKRYSGNDVQT